MKLGSNLRAHRRSGSLISPNGSSKLTMEPELDEAITLGPIFFEAISLFRDSIRAYADGNVVLARPARERP